MGNITYLEDYLKEKELSEQVIPFFDMLNTPYEQIIEDKIAMFSIPYKTDYLYVFLEYIPRNEHTEKPNIVDRFFNIKSNPRISSGEWVVHKIYTIGNGYHTEITEIINTNGINMPIIPSILEEIQK